MRQGRECGRVEEQLTWAVGNTKGSGQLEVQRDLGLKLAGSRRYGGIGYNKVLSADG